MRRVLRGPLVALVGGAGVAAVIGPRVAGARPAAVLIAAATVTVVAVSRRRRGRHGPALNHIDRFSGGREEGGDERPHRVAGLAAVPGFCAARAPCMWNGPNVRRWLVVAVAAVLALAGCHPAAPSRPDGAATADIPRALNFTADLVAGGQISGATLTGNDVALWFWAPW